MTTLFLPDDLDAAWHTPEHTYLTPEDKALLAGTEATVILSGQSVRALPHDLPSLRARERDAAARFHAEPLVGEAIEATHIVVGPDRMALVSRERMDAVIAALATAGVVPTAIYADHDVLPPATLPDRIVLEGATIDHGFPLEGELPPAMGLAEAATQLRYDQGLDLLSGPYARRRFGGGGIDTGWLRRAAAALAMVGVGFLTLQFAEARAERLQVEDLRERARTVYFEATGVDTPTPGQDAARLVERPAAPGALQLTATLFAALKDVDGVSIDSLEYSEREGTLDLVLAYPGFGATSQLEAAVASQGARLQAGGVREMDGRFVGNATLSGGS